MCTSSGSPTANARNNCHGIMAYDAEGKRSLRTFASREASAAYFKAIWMKGYGSHFPTMADARRYTGGDQACSWISNVTHYYTL